MKWPHERAFYRIEYPTRERPKFETNGEALDVLDACESGIRFEVRRDDLEIGDAVRGVVRFRRGDDVAVEGFVVRLGEGFAAIQLKPPGIPLKVMFDEQRFLLRHYPQQIRRPPQSA